MGRYSERQLLMLSNFVYIPACLSTGTISEILDSYKDERGKFTPESVAMAGYGGGMDTNDVATLFSRMDKEIEENPEFGKLSASRILEEEDVRAVCYTDTNDEAPVVAFRGTGGTQKAWNDNFEGLYEKDTELQKVAGDFIKYECGEYENLTVTGHSKGGNMAQYATIMYPEKVGRCVSYDGQGFGRDFIARNRNSILTASPKIKSISAYNDFVNILLFSVAGKSVYINNKGGVRYAHSSISLLTENEYDEKGDFVSLRTQGIVAESLDTATDGISVLLGTLPREDKEIIANAGSEIVTGAFKLPEDNLLMNSAGLVVGTVAGIIHRKISSNEKVCLGDTVLCVMQTKILWDEIRKCTILLSETIRSANIVKRRLLEMKDDINYTIAAKIYAEKIVNHAIASIEDSVFGMEGYSRLLTEITDRYKEREEAVKALFVS